jgi:hypothetical protein
MAQGVDPIGIINAAETALLLYPHGFYTWARRGAQAVQIHVADNDNQSYTVMVAVTMDGRKLPLFIIIQGKTVRCEWGLELDADGPDASAHSTTGWMTVKTMLLWLHVIRSHRSADGHDIHLILDCYAVHRCDAVRERAETLRIHLHVIRPGPTDVMQPLDRIVFGALQAEYCAIYRGGMAHQEDKQMTKADFTAYLMLAWGLASEEAIHRRWTCHDPDTRTLERELQAAVGLELRERRLPRATLLFIFPGGSSSVLLETSHSSGMLSPSQRESSDQCPRCIGLSNVDFFRN